MCRCGRGYDAQAVVGAKLRDRVCAVFFSAFGYAEGRVRPDWMLGVGDIVRWCMCSEAERCLVGQNVLRAGALRRRD